MSRDEILAMEPGRELDALVAEKVMGWAEEKNDDDLDDIFFPCYRVSENEERVGFYPSTDISAAFEVVEKVKGMLFSKRLRFSGKLQVMFPVETGGFVAWPDALFLLEPQHICKAALLAVMDA